ncbi:uncharacterized protein LOC133806230 [Humulus lupulus]|uniref:uncharacterized protein LOC133806230 n=1 Tax=Humulus lupulus TaxID=3486 RepID=UPI002B410A12|nr:uncharacterized protein LOC133806230 [Humulus lupulus]
MAKRKKPIRKPDILTDDRPEFVQQKVGLGLEGGDVADLEQGKEVPRSGFVQDGSMDRQGKESQPSEEVDDGLGAEKGNVTWADRSEENDRVTEGDFQSESQLHWQQFCSNTLSFSEPKLEFTEPLYRNGQKLAQVDVEEVRIQSANWSSAVVCMVLGANPPMAVFEGFIQRVWDHLGIAQISRMTLGLTLVKFNDEATRDHVLENGVLQFDRKPIIMRPWTTDLSAIRMIRLVPLWIRLHDLGLQYWGSKCISALVSTFGKPLLIDKFTKERSRVQFARVLVEMEITDNPPRSFQFINEHGQVVEQGIEYEWLPTKCKSYFGFGHTTAECRNDQKAVWVEKKDHSNVEKPLVNQDCSEGAKEGITGETEEGSKHTEDLETGEGDMTLSVKTNSGLVMERNKEVNWQTPRRVISQRQGHVAGSTSMWLLRFKNRKTNLVFCRSRNGVVRLGILMTIPLMDKCSILSWNVRGLNRVNKQCSVQEVFRKNKIGVSGLMETKLRGNKLDEFMEHKFPNWDFYSSPLTEGRLLILWRKGIANLSILEDSPQLVHCQINWVGDQDIFFVTFVYGFNSVENRRSLWRDLTRILLSVKAWMVLGDFNAPFSGGDRSGGSPITSSELADPIEWKINAKTEAIKSMGSFFTWANNQVGLARIYSKIYHAFINEEWLDMFPQCLAVFQWEVVSDHCSCLVSNFPLKFMGTKLFRFFNFWTNHPDFNQLVLKSWRAPVNAAGLRAIFTRLIRLKHQLKKLNRDCCGDVGSGYQLALEAFQTAQLKSQENPQDFQLQEVVKDRASKFHYQEHIYHSFLVQRSKINWIRKGDVNSSFFHAFLEKRKADNSIVSYINEHGMLIDDIKEVVDHFVEHFKNHLGSLSTATGTVNLNCIASGTKLSVEQQLYLLKPFSVKEIIAAMFSIPSIKSPGPDGYGSGFFKSMWKDIGQDICSAIIHVFSTGQFSKERHETTLSLIPKVSNPARASDFRPIACCSTLYKVMAKLLFSRLAVVLPYLIQSNQGAFVRGRSIAHNIMILQDLIKNYGRALTSLHCAIKIDLSKAYDTVDWYFLENLLKAYCFPMKFIGWVMSCIRSTSYSLLINGRVQSSFKGEKGLRQGDPMSPILFVLIMEYMTRCLQLDARSPSFRFHPMCKSLKLINLCFADDVILFCKGSSAVVNILKDSLRKFSEASGLSINTKKSQIYFGGVSADVKTEILQVLQLPAGSFPLHYLGVPLRPTKWKHVDCEIIIQKMRTKLFSWSSKHLSYAGRLLLIQSVLFGLRNYWMSVFILPQSIIKEVEKLCRQFLWGASGTPSKLHLASWHQVCMPKAYGGLGLRDGASWNRALLAKKRFNEGEVLAVGSSGIFRPSKLYNSSLNQHLVAYKNAVWCRTTLPKNRCLFFNLESRLPPSMFEATVSVSKPPPYAFFIKFVIFVFGLLALEGYRFSDCLEALDISECLVELRFPN